MFLDFLFWRREKSFALKDAPNFQPTEHNSPNRLVDSIMVRFPPFTNPDRDPSIPPCSIIGSCHNIITNQGGRGHVLDNNIVGNIKLIFLIYSEKRSKNENKHSDEMENWPNAEITTKPEIKMNTVDS